jgi:hypothetical protein
MLVVLPEPTAISRHRPPDLVPGYHLERLVGKGGMGEVHRGIQLSLGRTVAVKVLNTELARDPSFVTRFEKEAAALAQLSHPNIVSIVDKGRTETTYYLVMEFVDGPSLREVMRSPLLDAPKSLRMALEICRAVEYAHGRGVIHRDLKPENILFDEQAGGIPKVTDFGLANFLDPDSSQRRYNVTETHMAMGTVAYMAPEQRLDAKKVDERADIYSLGVIFYELLTGDLPMGAFEPPSQRQPKLDRRLDAIIERCLKPSPEDRFQSVTELMSELEPICPPVAFTSGRGQLKPLERVMLQARVASQKFMRAVGALLVLAAAGHLGLTYLRERSRVTPVPAGAALTAPDLVFQNARSLSAKVTEDDQWRTLLLGPGADSTQVLAQGRPANLDMESGIIQFGPPPNDNWVGRAQLDVVDLDSVAVSFSAEVRMAPGKPRFFNGVTTALLDRHLTPRSALLLTGGLNRYAAVVAPFADGPLMFEWSLGDKKGTMIGPPVPPGSELKLSLRVDKEGRLTAHYATLETAGFRPLGEPVQLGAHWKEYFKKAPSPAVGCLEALCTFTRLRYELEHEPPPLEALPAPVPPRVVATPAVVTRPTLPTKRTSTSILPLKKGKPTSYRHPRR